MFGSEILDVAIGLILVFLTVSLICSSAREAIETVFKHRASDLERGICEMLGPDVAQRFYNQPLVNGLFKGNYQSNKRGNLPSYIPPGTFALALMQVAKTVGQHADISQAVRNLPLDSKLKGALVPLIVAAEGDPKRVRQNIEDWYNASMDRVAGWYKRRTQIIIAALGFTIAGVMNIDAVAITRYLNTNQTARSVLVNQAQLRNRSADTSDPMTFLTRQGGLPCGWLFTPETNQSGADFMRDWRRAPATPREWLLKIAGLLFTGFAVSLGAPFWFDVLNRFMVIRSTVKPAEKSPDERSKD